MNAGREVLGVVISVVLDRSRIRLPCDLGQLRVLECQVGAWGSHLRIVAVEQ